jgi:TetR/AcrR family transcriptional repressor of nem operon
MGHSQAQKAETRRRLLALAANEIRENGLPALAIGRLMERAGLTHGGFYGHFTSREALIAAALQEALSGGEVAALKALSASSGSAAVSVVRGYLSKTHRDHPEAGCAIASLVSDVARLEGEPREIMKEKMRGYVARLAEATDDTPEEAAWAAWATMIGALQLARLFRGDPEGDKILTAGRKAALALIEEA